MKFTTTEDSLKDTSQAIPLEEKEVKHSIEVKNEEANEEYYEINTFIGK